MATGRQRFLAVARGFPLHPARRGTPQNVSNIWYVDPLDSSWPTPQKLGELVDIVSLQQLVQSRGIRTAGVRVAFSRTSAIATDTVRSAEGKSGNPTNNDGTVVGTNLKKR